MRLKFERFLDNKYEIVEDGLLSNIEMGEGRLIPGVVVKSKKKDTSLNELINVHQETPSGDVVVNWGIPPTNFLKRDKVYLHLKFIQPMEIMFQIEFRVREHYSLIDSIIQSRGLWLGVGKKGEKVSMKVNAKEMISIEVPDTGFDAMWNKMFRDALKKKFRKQGVPKKHLKEAVEEHINHIREILQFRREIR